MIETLLNGKSQDDVPKIIECQSPTRGLLWQADSLRVPNGSTVTVSTRDWSRGALPRCEPPCFFWGSTNWRNSALVGQFDERAIARNTPTRTLQLCRGSQDPRNNSIGLYRRRKPRNYRAGLMNCSMGNFQPLQFLRWRSGDRRFFRNHTFDFPQVDGFAAVCRPGPSLMTSGGDGEVP